MRPPRKHERRAAATIEFAVVAPAVVMILIGLLVVGLGVFRYQQVGRLARDGSRWASVHGTDYAVDNGASAATPADVYTYAIASERGRARRAEVELLRLPGTRATARRTPRP